MSNKVYRIIEDFPINGELKGYFVKGAYVTIDGDKFPLTICKLCNEQGELIYNSKGDEISITHSFENTDIPIWNNKVEYYDNSADSYELLENTGDAMDVLDLVEVLENFEEDTTVYLDYNGTIERMVESEGMSVTVLMEGINEDGITYKLIAVTEHYTTVPLTMPDTNDIDALLNSDSVESLTINFNK